MNNECIPYRCQAPTDRGHPMNAPSNLVQPPAITPQIILGVDPGLSGAFALLQPSTGQLVVQDMPTLTLSRGGKAKREVDIAELARLIDAAAPISHAYVEQVGAMPGQGVSSVFAFGKAYGVVLGVLAANFVPVTLVAPQHWKRALGVPAAKDGARARASQLLPAHSAGWCRVKDDGRAESALIAYYGASHGRKL